MTLGRDKYLAALIKLYEKHPVGEPFIIEGRKSAIQALDAQIQQIQQIVENYDQIQARLQILRVDFGL